MSLKITDRKDGEKREQRGGQIIPAKSAGPGEKSRARISWVPCSSVDEGYLGREHEAL